MFSLILTIVAIALTILLILFSMYYGGDSMTKGHEEAIIAKSLNEVTQLRGALVAYNARTGTAANSLDDLVGFELKGVPAGWGLNLPSLTAFEASRVEGTTPATRRSSCVEINKRLGLNAEDPPACDAIPSNFTGCCVMEDDAEATPTP